MAIEVCPWNQNFANFLQRPQSPDQSRPQKKILGCWIRIKRRSCSKNKTSRDMSPVQQVMSSVASIVRVSATTGVSIMMMMSEPSSHGSTAGLSTITLYSLLQSTFTDMMKIVQRLGITNIVASRMTTIAISITIAIIAITLNVCLVAITLSLPSTSLSPTN